MPRFDAAPGIFRQRTEKDVEPPAHERIRAVLVFSLKLIVASLVFSVLAGLPVLGVYYLYVHVGAIVFVWLLFILLYLALYFFIIVDTLIGWVGGKEWRERREQRRNQRLEQKTEERRQREEEWRQGRECYQEVVQRQRFERSRAVRSRKYERSRPAQGQRSERGVEYDRYMKSEAWREKAEEAKQRAGHRCQLCNKANTVLHVHHRTYERLGKELPDDLIVLCAGCHSKFHDKLPNRRRRTKRRR